MADAVAFTSTPDASAGNPIDVTTVVTGAGTVDRQRVAVVNDGATALAVSATSLPLPTGASTEATLALIKAKTDNLDVALSTRTKPADSQTVTGTVATTVADGANVNQGANADAAVTGDTAGTLSAKLRGLIKIFGDIWDSTNHAVKIEGTGIGGSANAVAVVQSGPFNIKDTVGGSILVAAKGTQPATLVGVQDAKDSGRTFVCITIDRAAGIAAEALATMTINKGGTVTTGTSYTVTTGKTLRLQVLKASVRASTTTIVSGRIRLRTAASVLATSPILALLEIASNGAIAEDINVDDISFPDGIEVAAAQQIGISHVESTATGTVSVTLVGFEY